MTATAVDWPVAVLAGGLATRLRPISATIPKALVEVAGEPFVAHQLRLLARRGVRRVVLLLGHLGEQVAAYVGDGARFGLSIQCQFDGDRLLGTGGAVRRALPLLGERFIVTYGDSYLDVPIAPIARAFARNRKPALMVVLRNEGRWDTSNVTFRPDGTVHYDKRHPSPAMAYIDYGIALLRSEVLSRYEPNVTLDLADVYQALSARGELAGYEVFRRFYEIGTPEALAEADRHFRKMSMATEFTSNYYKDVLTVAQGIDTAAVDAMIDILVDVRAGGGRLFILGVGGGAGHAGHAVNDFRKICGIEAYAPTDNVSELTARTNDEGWATVFAAFLETSRIGERDAVLVLSVGGGNAEKNISPNIVEALKLAKRAGARVIGIVGRDGGYTAKVADACVVVPTVNPDTITPHTESFQAVVWHGMVSHPKLQANEMKWESTR